MIELLIYSSLHPTPSSAAAMLEIFYYSQAVAFIYTIKNDSWQTKAKAFVDLFTA
jgi:hypothetical protein